MRIGDQPLAPSAVAAAARTGAIDVALSDEARARMERAHGTAAAATRARPVYGRTTGVGANRSVHVEGGDEREHGLRLLRSHAGGMGEPQAPEVVRAPIPPAWLRSSRSPCSRSSPPSTSTLRFAPTPVVRP